MSNRRRLSSTTMPSVSENMSPPDYSGPFSPVPPFQSLQTLGVCSAHDELPLYEELFRRQNFMDYSSNGQRVNLFKHNFLLCKNNNKYVLFNCLYDIL